MLATFFSMPLPVSSSLMVIMAIAAFLFIKLLALLVLPARNDYLRSQTQAPAVKAQHAPVRNSRAMLTAN
jgi:hypothetical protein